MEVLKKENIPGYNDFVKCLFSANKEYDVFGKLSELNVIDFFLQHPKQFKIACLEPKTGNKKVDLLITDTRNEKLYIEVRFVYLANDVHLFEDNIDYFLEKLEFLRTGLMIQVKGLSLFDEHWTEQGTLRSTPTKFSKPIADKIINNFKTRLEGVDNIENFPYIINNLSEEYPNIEVKIIGRSSCINKTAVRFIYDESGRGIDSARVARRILEEKEHFQDSSNNVIVVDFSLHSDFRSAPADVYDDYYFNKMLNHLNKGKSSRVDAILSFSRNNQDANLINRQLLYLDKSKEIQLGELLTLWSGSQ